jgi:Zn-dependent peptidase ImmA (M78 family)
MNAAISQLTARGWNRRILSPSDFEEWCETEKIAVIEVAMKPLGLYVVRDEQPFIFINEKLRGIEKQIVQWHEFGHHILHVPSGRYFSYSVPNKAEYQAHLIAAVALLPAAELKRKSKEELLEEYPKELVGFRERVRRQFRI